MSDLIEKVKEATMSRDPKIRQEVGREVKLLLQTFVAQLQTLTRTTTISPLQYTPLSMSGTFAKKLIHSFGTPLQGLGAQEA